MDSTVKTLSAFLTGSLLFGFISAMVLAWLFKRSPEGVNQISSQWSLMNSLSHNRSTPGSYWRDQLQYYHLIIQVMILISYARLTVFRGHTNPACQKSGISGPIEGSSLPATLRFTPPPVFIRNKILREELQPL